MEDQQEQPIYSDNFGKVLETCTSGNARAHSIPIELANTEIYEMDWLYMWEYIGSHME